MSHTPPVARDGFAYANDSFFAEASNHNRHRRATLPELQSLFHPSASSTRTSADKEPVGHWYEAQLLHYGLPPSKNKAVAKTRLLDALNKGTLSVPEHVRKLEGELEKEWVKNERAAKKAAKEQKTSVESGVMAKNADSGRGKDAAKGKRKRDAEGNTDTGSLNINVSLNLGANTLPPGDTTSTKRAKQTARRGGSNAAGIEPEKTVSESKPINRSARRAEPSFAVFESGRGAARPKQTARYSGPPRGAPSSRGRVTTGRSRGTVRTQHVASTSQSPQGTPSRGSPRSRQTARRSHALPPRRGQGTSSNARVKNEIDLKDEVKEEGYFKEEDSDVSNYQGQYSPYGYSDEEDNYTDQDQSPGLLGPLGLINGLYEIESNKLDQWSMFDAEDFSLILCLEGSSVWGAYDFGMHSGILYLDTRPSNSSFDEVPFSWRGRENSEGETSFGPNNHGWIQFLGNGMIEGMINCYGEARFSGQRVSGKNETRAPRDARSMRSEWEGYNQSEYDRANRARWGGSYW
ncbi:MAG: hypothetical protein M1820_003747 [Bogoriella megaspora]|nr:MAG: hypothetical protein M1820_003747 [Bogoriella megaspora]